MSWIEDEQIAAAQRINIGIETKTTDVEAELLAYQKRRCAHCGMAIRQRSDYVIDHEHSSGLVRGLLCYSCNTKEGCGGEVWDSYRVNPPAALIGLSALYSQYSVIGRPDNGRYVDQSIWPWSAGFNPKWNWSVSNGQGQQQILDALKRLFPSHW